MRGPKMLPVPGAAPTPVSVSSRGWKLNGGRHAAATAACTKAQQCGAQRTLQAGWASALTAHAGECTGNEAVTREGWRGGAEYRSLFVPRLL